MATGDELVMEIFERLISIRSCRESSPMINIIQLNLVSMIASAQCQLMGHEVGLTTRSTAEIIDAMDGLLDCMYKYKDMLREQESL